MAQIERGTVSTVVAAGARVILDTSGRITQPLVIPWHLRGAGDLAADVKVVAAVFEDETGIVLARADGVWSGNLPQQLTVTDLATAAVASLNAHRHGGVEEGAGTTGGPQ